MTTRSATAVMVISTAMAAGPAAADVANFDPFGEGDVGTVVVQSGITFSNLSRRFDLDPVPAPFVIDRADTDLTGEPGFTPNNVLGFTTWSPGPSTVFARFGQLDITPDEPSTFVSLHLWEIRFPPFMRTEIILEAFRDGALVRTEVVPSALPFGRHHYEIRLHGVEFDALRLRIGPTDESVIFAVIDTVTIEARPICAPDCDASADLSPADFACFRDAFLAGDGDGDFNGDGDLTPADFAAFRNAFLAGCP